MFIPRVKKEELHGNTKIKLPVKVFFADAEAEKLATAIQELMPYLKLAKKDKREKADFVFACVAGISDKPEYYEIDSEDGHVSVSAKDFRGLVNAVATLAQMIEYSNGEFTVKDGKIADWPDKSFRSFMIDTGRKYIPIDEFRAQILMMAKSKLNKLHIHISDGQGCPIEFESYPDIAFKGQYGKKYTKDEIRELVAYASAFGIDVIPEIDMPGHAQEIISSYPELACVTKKRRNGWCFCISSEDSYTFIEKILSELCELFPYEYIHVGTDEIDMQDVPLLKTRGLRATQDWERCERCKKKFRTMGLRTTTEKFYYFVNRVYDIVTGLGKKMMMWNDNIDIAVSPEIPRDILIEFWRVAGEHRGPREGCSMQRFIDEGFEVINADYPMTYMDLPEYMSFNGLKDWNLTSFPANAGERSFQILGAECCAWDVQKHFAYSVYTAVPAFADRCYNLAPIDNAPEFETALTRFALGVTTPAGYNAFSSHIKDIVMTDNDCKILKDGCDKEELRSLLKSLSRQNAAEKALTKAYLKYSK